MPKRPGSGLALAAVMWLGLTGWLLVGGRPWLAASDAPSSQEPPPEPTLWNRVTRHTSYLIGRGEPDVTVASSLEKLGVPAWHKASVRGAGIKVAILDSGFRGYKKALGKALPKNVTVKSFRKDGNLEAKNSQHGILCAEIIHHIAPEAELLFANWEPETPEQFLQAVRWVRKEGAHLISCSIIMPSWSDGEGGGKVHEELTKILGKGDKGDGLFVASAGNTALRHWAGTFNPGRDGWHLWTNLRRENTIRPYGADRVSVELTMPRAVSYELVIRDQSAGKDVGRARTRTVNGVTSAVVRFDPNYGHRYAVRLRAVTKHAPRERFHVTVLGGKLGEARKAGSIPFPADGAGVIAVGAVDSKGHRHAYSSCGPAGKGTKPDLTATVPFPSNWRPEQPFAGTSAASPQVAGVAALIWSRYPNLTAAQVREKLHRAAGKKHDTEKGYGMVKLPE